MVWDFFSLRAESTQLVTMINSDRGIPDGFRYMDGHGINTFKLVNLKSEAVYCKFHYKSNQGIRNISSERAVELAGSDPDYAVRDLYNAIEEGDFPSWTLYIQVMTFEEAENWEYNPFDATKVWPHHQFPLREVGKIVFNRNPSNYFMDVEQAAFCPANLIPGIEASPDKLLQGRLFSYSDTHRHRVGANVQQIPVNCPYNTKVRNYQRNGPQAHGDNQDGAPNYYPNSFGGPVENQFYNESVFTASGDVDRFNSSNEDNFTQTGLFWRKVLKADERDRLVENIATSLSGAKEFIQERAVRNFSAADTEYGKRVKEALLKLRNSRKQNGLARTEQ